MTKNELLIHSRLLSWVISQLCQVTDPFLFVCRSSVKFFNRGACNFWSLKYHRNIVKTFVAMVGLIVILAKPVRGKSLVKMNFVIIFVFEIHWKIDKIISLCHFKNNCILSRPLCSWYRMTINIKSIWNKLIDEFDIIENKSLISSSKNIVTSSYHIIFEFYMEKNQFWYRTLHFSRDVIMSTNDKSNIIYTQKEREKYTYL